jgi:hypothetical protein
VEKYGTARQATDDNVIRGMRFLCWINKDTAILRIYNSYCISTGKIISLNNSVQFVFLMELECASVKQELNV